MLHHRVANNAHRHSLPYLSAINLYYHFTNNVKCVPRKSPRYEPHHTRIQCPCRTTTVARGPPYRCHHAKSGVRDAQTTQFIYINFMLIQKETEYFPYIYNCGHAYVVCSYAYVYDRSTYISNGTAFKHRASANSPRISVDYVLLISKRTEQSALKTTKYKAKHNTAPQYRTPSTAITLILYIFSNILLPFCGRLAVA